MADKDTTSFMYILPFSKSTSVPQGTPPATKEGGEYALRSLDAAAKDLQEGLIDALITAPINKEAMKKVQSWAEANNLK